MSTQRRRLNRVRAVAQLLAFACAVSVAGSTAALAHATVPAAGTRRALGLWAVSVTQRASRLATRVLLRPQATPRVWRSELLWRAPVARSSPTRAAPVGPA